MVFVSTFHFDETGQGLGVVDVRHYGNFASIEQGASKISESRDDVNWLFINVKNNI